MFLKDLVGKLAIRTQSNAMNWGGYQTSFLYVHRIQDGNVIVACADTLKNISFDFVKMTTEEIENKIANQEIKIEQLHYMWNDAHWMDYRSLLNREVSGATRPELKYLNELIGKRVLRFKSTKRGFPGFQDTPKFLVNATDTQLVLFDADCVYNLKYKKTFKDMTSQEIYEGIANGTLRATILDSCWIDTSWDDYNKLLREEPVLTNPASIFMQQFRGKYMIQKNWDKAIYLFKVTDHQIWAFDPECIYNMDVDSKYLEPAEIETMILNGTIYVSMYTQDWITDKWYSYDDLMKRVQEPCVTPAGISMKELENQFAIRILPTKDGFPGFQDKAVYIYHATDHHVVIYDPSYIYNCDYPYNGESSEAINLAIQAGLLRTRILTHTWMDIHWCKTEYVRK